MTERSQWLIIDVFLAQSDIYFIIIPEIKMELFQKGTIYDTKYSNFNLTQSAAEHLFDKYSQKCCFFKAKDINRLIFGEKCEKRVIDFKDVLVVAQEIEYLKRYYQAKNSQGKNELKERMRLLKSTFDPISRLLRDIGHASIRVPNDGDKLEIVNIPKTPKTVQKAFKVRI